MVEVQVDVSPQLYRIHLVCLYRSIFVRGTVQLVNHSRTCTVYTMSRKEDDPLPVKVVAAPGGVVATVVS